MMSDFGRLEKIEARTAWTNEATGFTPWLAEPNNLRLLGEAIGIELEFEAQEKSVGPFRADILCKDTLNGNWVLIENQLARTDHTHLGQILTYAAGLKAVTIVWISTLFTEEHRATLDWLNQITDSKFNFFGLEIELWRIGISPVAPKFNIVCKPNDWSKTVAEEAARVESATLTETKQNQIKFWSLFRDRASSSTRIKPQKPAPNSWMVIAIGRTGFKLVAVASLWNSERNSYETNELRAEVEVYGNDSKEYFGLLESDRAQIELELGYPLIWQKTEDSQKCKAFVRKSADITNENDWPEQHQWLIERLEELHRVFAARIRNLSILE